MSDQVDKGGRPLIVLTDAQREQVENLARVGMSIELISDHLGIARKTFYNLLDRDPALSKSYARGLAEGLALIHSTAYSQAMEGNPAMLALILKTKGGWREAPKAVELSGDGGGPLKVVISGADADL